MDTSLFMENLQQGASFCMSLEIPHSESWLNGYMLYCKLKSISTRGEKMQTLAKGIWNTFRFLHNAETLGTCLLLASLDQQPYTGWQPHTGSFLKAFHT